MAFSIEVAPTSTSITIGDDYLKENRIAFTISLRGDECVWLTLQVPLRADGVLRQPEDANDVDVVINGSTPAVRKPEASEPNIREWWLSDADDGVQLDSAKPTQLSISIRNILCRADEGDSEVVVMATSDSEDKPRPVKLSVTKSKPTTSQQEDRNPILYFIAEPTYLIQQKRKVTLTWAVAGDEQTVLETENGEKTVRSPTTDSPSRTWNYTLKTGNKKRQVAVNVLDGGWHRDLAPLGDQAFPTVIFDSAGRRTDYLYAIFVRARGENGRESVLCRSANGITGWEVIDTEVPEGMESSPGLQLRNRLWMIGGSTVDPKQISNRVFCYDLDRNAPGWRETPIAGFEDGARMGHACAIVDDDTIWMLGGMDMFHSALNDVWRLEIGDDGSVQASRETVTQAFTPRCMFGAVRFGDAVWICGGVSSPNGKTLNDVWSCDLPVRKRESSVRGPIAWSPRPASSVVQNAIGTGVAYCGGKRKRLYAVVTKREGRNAREFSVLGIDSITETTNPWSDEKAPEFPADVPTVWTSTPHSVALVAFNDRLYLRYLHRNALHGQIAGWPLFVYV